MQLQLSLILIFVKDIAKLRSFYVDILKLIVIEEPVDGWIVLNAGGCNIALHKIGDQYLNKNNTGFKVHSNTKLVFNIKEDIHQLRDKLLAQGVLIKEIKTFDNYDYWLCDGEDPEGNVFQLQQKKQ